MIAPHQPSARGAIVTGAAQGIGAATAIQLAADGNELAVLDLGANSCSATVGKIVADGGRALAVGADVSDAQAVESAVQRVAAELGPPVILVTMPVHRREPIRGGPGPPAAPAPHGSVHYSTSSPMHITRSMTRRSGK